MKSAKIVCFVFLVFIKPQIQKAYHLSNLNYFVWAVQKGTQIKLAKEEILGQPCMQTHFRKT